MLSNVRSRTTFANVVSLIALFVAVGLGTAWAVERNSVKSKHIVNGQVKAGDLARAEAWREVAPFQEGSTETGRFRGTSGSCSDGASFPCRWHNNPYPPAHNTAAFYRDPYGRVHLKGFVCRLENGAVCSNSATAVQPDDIFQLPPGYRPGQMIEVATVSEGQFGRVQIGPDGTVSAALPFDYNSLSLENVSFRCAPAGVSGCP